MIKQLQKLQEQKLKFLVQCSKVPMLIQKFQYDNTVKTLKKKVRDTDQKIPNTTIF